MAERFEATEAAVSTPPARLPRSPFATLSFWCGVGAWAAALLTPVLLSFALLIAFPLSVFAVGVGIVAFFHIRRAPLAWGGRRWAIAGICSGGFWLIFLLVVIVASIAR